MTDVFRPYGMVICKISQSVLALRGLADFGSKTLCPVENLPASKPLTTVMIENLSAVGLAMLSPGARLCRVVLKKGQMARVLPDAVSMLGSKSEKSMQAIDCSTCRSRGLP